MWYLTVVWFAVNRVNRGIMISFSIIFCIFFYIAIRSEFSLNFRNENVFYARVYRFGNNLKIVRDPFLFRYSTICWNKITAIFLELGPIKKNRFNCFAVRKVRNSGFRKCLRTSLVNRKFKKNTLFKPKPLWMSMQCLYDIDGWNI